MSEALARALEWAEAGWPVFPFGKHGFPEWQKRATTDLATLNGWDWSSAKVGVVPGLAGCFAVDVDVKKGKDGRVAHDEILLESGVETWELPQQATPNGGTHYFWRGSAPTSVGLLADGIDVRGGRGDLVAMVGETLSGGLGFVFAYGPPPCAVASAPVAPPALVARCGTPRTRAVPDGGAGTSAPLVELDLPVNVARAEAFLARAPSPLEGSRNLNLFKTAATLRDLGVSRDKAFEMIANHRHVLGTPEMEEDRSYATINSAWRNGQLQPGHSALDPARLAGILAEYADGDLPPARTVARSRLSLWSERRDRPPLPWLVRRILPQRALSGLYGPGGSFKSFVALDLALHVANGRPVWGGESIVGHGPVIYASSDGSIEPRVRAWEALNGPSSDMFALLDGLNLNDVDGIVCAVEEIEQAAKGWEAAPMLLIVDTLHSSSGGADENSARDMGQIVEALKGLRARLGCAILLIHHTPKGSSDWRGSQAVYWALDTGLKIRADGTLAATITVDRQKDGRTGQRYHVGLRQLDTGREVDGDKENSLVVTSIEVKKDRGAGPAPEQARGALQRVQAQVIVEGRVKAAAKVLSGMRQGSAIDPGPLAKMLAATLKQPESVENIRKWLHKAKKEDDHPLAAFVALRDPLSFTAPAVTGPEENGQ